MNFLEEIYQENFLDVSSPLKHHLMGVANTKTTASCHMTSLRNKQLVKTSSNGCGKH